MEQVQPKPEFIHKLTNNELNYVGYNLWFLKLPEILSFPDNVDAVLPKSLSWVPASVVKSLAETRPSNHQT